MVDMIAERTIAINLIASVQACEIRGNVDSRPKIRLQFNAPLGSQRELLVGVDERTSDNFDIGFDGPLNEDNKEDMFWLIGEGKFVIQGVDNFNKDQELPLGVKIAKAGLVRIKIDALENIDNEVNISVRDLSGKLTYSESLNRLAKQTHVINTVEWTSGAYIVSIETNGMLVTHKVIK